VPNSVTIRSVGNVGYFQSYKP